MFRIKRFQFRWNSKWTKCKFKSVIFLMAFKSGFYRSCSRVQEGLWKPLSLLKDVLHQNSQHSSTHLCAVESELSSTCKCRKWNLHYVTYLSIYLKLTIYTLANGLFQRSNSLFFYYPIKHAQTDSLFHNKSDFYEILLLLFIYACIEAILKMQLMICIIGATQKMAL